MKGLSKQIVQLLSLLILKEILHNYGNSLEQKIDNENYYQLCTINKLIAIDSHYQPVFEFFLYKVYKECNLNIIAKKFYF